MKKDSIVIISLGSLAVVLSVFSTILIVRQTGKKAKSDDSSKEKIERKVKDKDDDDDVTDKKVRNDIKEFDHVILKMYNSSSGDSAEYRIFCKGDICNVYIYKYEGSTHQLIYTGTADTKDALELLNECEILSWGGIKTPRGKQNFEFDANVNGQDLSSKGSLLDVPKNKDIFTEKLQEWTTLMGD